ncbi:MAG: translation elongation factor Ts [Chloroflexota bacterium]|nr:translation elongation factor Ts [Chloroflexota bacterium]
MQISTEMVKALREETQAGIMDCRNALLEANGNQRKATEILKKQGLARVQKRSERTAVEGVVESYVHYGGRIGALIEVNCETDFVARTEEFKQLAHDLALQVAASSPLCLTAEEMPKGSLQNPNEACLLLQKSIKDDSKTVQEMVDDVAVKMREKVTVKRFVRFELGG